MNWKHLFALIAAPVASSLGIWGQNTLNGQHVAFTTGNILIPAIPVLLASLAHLYMAPPSSAQ
jgi:hypothetical protein